MHVDDDCRRLVHPRGLILVLYSVNNFCHVGKHDWSAVAISNHHVTVVFAGNQLIVGIDLEVLARAVEVSLGGVYAGLSHGGAEVLKIDAIGRQSGRVGLNAHGGVFAAADRHQAHPTQLRNFRR